MVPDNDQRMKDYHRSYWKEYYQKHKKQICARLKKRKKHKFVDIDIVEYVNSILIECQKVNPNIELKHGEYDRYNMPHLFCFNIGNRAIASIYINDYDAKIWLSGMKPRWPEGDIRRMFYQHKMKTQISMAIVNDRLNGK